MTIKLSITAIDKARNEQRRYLKYLRLGESFIVVLKKISENPAQTSSHEPEVACFIKNENEEIILLDRTDKGIFLNAQKIEKAKINDGDQALLPHAINLSFGVYPLTGKDIFKSTKSSKEPLIIEYVEPEKEQKKEIDYSNPVGHEIDGYYFEDVLSYGSMGIVYKGVQKSLNRKVAIKTVSPKNLKNNILIKRFMNMASMAWRLNHPYIVQIYDTGISREFQMHYVVMEYIEGETLREVLNRQKKLPVETACKVISHLASALSFAHRQNIIHRDVNPSNIIITKNDYIKLIGLALSKVIDPNEERMDLTMKGQAMGTMGYIAPEQAKSAAEVDFRADIYSMGVIFYECLCGRSPYDPNDLKDPVKYAKALRQKPGQTPSKVNPLVPKALDDIVMKCLDPNPEKRYQKADLVLDDVKTYTESLSLSAAQKRIRAMFPKTPNSRVFDFHVLFEPMEEIGGDFYDYIPLEDEKWGIVIGDVTGHGVEAAVVMGMVKSVIKIMAKNLDSAAEVLEYANKEISPDMDTTTFTTVAYGILDSKNKTLRFARAGHHPLILYNPNRDPSLITFAPKGTILGVPWSLNVEEIEISLQPGDMMLQYTDGITEIKSKKGEEFGIERLCEVIEQQGDISPKQMAEAIQKSVEQFSKDTSDMDDITLLIVKLKNEA
ncbi:MAG: SpoIIE family protein phosphatase [Candidatus Brocadiae bacterium]|nr:SpoIIE family protein phosphatase [Candidatus Brocadiia bacterium]